MNPEKMEQAAVTAVEETRRIAGGENRTRELHRKIEEMTANLDRMYMDRLNGLLAEKDFERIYHKVREDRIDLENRLKNMGTGTENTVSTEDRAKELVSAFVKSAGENRELLVSLIERVELTEDREVIIKFRFRDPMPQG